MKTICARIFLDAKLRELSAELSLIKLLQVSQSQLAHLRSPPRGLARCRAGARGDVILYVIHGVSTISCRANDLSAISRSKIIQFRFGINRYEHSRHATVIQKVSHFIPH